MSFQIIPLASPSPMEYCVQARIKYIQQCSILGKVSVCKSNNQGLILSDRPTQVEVVPCKYLNDH